jgi:hypothetical protein
MKYKISTYVLLCIVGVMTVYSCKKNETATAQVEPSAQSSIQQDGLDSTLFKAFQQGRRVDPDLTGQFIDQPVAAAQALEFRNFRNNSTGVGGFKNEPYGFGFGLNKLKRLIQLIDQENARLSPNDTNRITGVRAFLVRRQTQGRPHNDIVLVPCKASGFNYISIGDPETDSTKLQRPSMLLNTSSPCPDQCDPD